MADQATSPTSMLWAYKLRRENKELHIRINALESQNIALTNQVATYNTAMAAVKAKVEVLEATREEYVEDRNQIADLTHKVVMLEKKLWSKIEGASQATTIEEEAVPTITPVVRKRPYTNDGATEEDQILQRKINTLLQEGMSTRQYIELAESVLQTATRANEIVIVKAFVFGIADEKQRKYTESSLVKKGWTWQVAKEAFEEVEKPATTRRKAPKRYIIPPDEVKRMRAQGITL
ncbi:MAG: hypothetical protein M1835_006177 [Candelina submexicana]|nr:MAG: hypothetical protein M1835_006177 [Candelina submexicana]